MKHLDLDLVKANTLLSFEKRILIHEHLEATEILGGAVAEVGVYLGGATLMIGAATKRKMYSIDTFEGLPSVCEFDNFHARGSFAGTSYEYVKELVKDYPNVSVMKAFFPNEKANFLEHESFSFVHLDVDLYQSTLDCLKWFWPRMISGGAIVIDDYNEPTCEGVNIAVDQFMKDEPFRKTLGQAVIIKK